jgi:alkylhydroperoxidase/carboxymuconolactone decarboxylase family protein YurZ
VSAVEDSRAARLTRGRELQDRMRPGMAAHVQNRFSGPSADFGDYTTEFLFGEIWQRPGLDLRTKEIVVLSALVAGRHLHDFRVHLSIAPNLGITRTEIIEIIYQTSMYIGLPAAGDAMAIVAEVLGNDEE